MQTWIRLARYTVEKPILDAHADFKWFAVPANILAFYSSSLSTFIGKMNRHYFVDPLTYQFQFPASFTKNAQENLPDGSKRSTLVPKGSFTKLFKAYGSDIFDQGKIVKDLTDDTILKACVSNILGFQLSALRAQKSKKQKYAELAGEVEPVVEPEPDFLVPPYFYFQNTDDPWFGVTKKALEIAKELHTARQIYCAICFEKRLLFDENACKEILKAFSKADGYLLLVSDFDEQRESVDLLRGFNSFVTRLANQGRPVINLYGQYFSMLLVGKLKGVSFGLCVNESKDVTRATQAGRMTVRFYQKRLHVKLREPQAREFILKHIGSTDCACNFCNEMRTLMSINTSERSRLNAMDYVFKNDRGALLAAVIEHFLRNRSEEVALVSSNSEDALLRYLQVDAADASSLGYQLMTNITHLEKWAESLSSAGST
jgi:hypothetical protein